MGKMNINKVIESIVGIIVLFLLYGALVPEAQIAGNSMNVSNQCNNAGCYYNVTLSPSQCYVNNTDAIACTTNTGIPLSGLFSGSGFVFVLLMIGLLLLIVRGVIGKKGK